MEIILVKFRINHHNCSYDGHYYVIILYCWSYSLMSETSMVILCFIVILCHMSYVLWSYYTVVSERKLINVWLIEFNDKFKNAIKGQSSISTLRAIISRKILDNLQVWRIISCRCITEATRRIRIKIPILCGAKENMGSLVGMVMENGVEFFRHRKLYTVLKKYCN